MPSARAEAVARVALLSMIAVAVAWLGLVGGLPGAALIVGILLLPAPLLLRAPWQWALPAAAPLLGGIGIAPAYPALAALAGSSRERATLAILGWAWLVVSEAILGSRLLFGTESAPGGWSGSLLEAGSEVVLGPLTPDSALLALAWVAASVLLGAVMRGRTVALELLAVLVWAAGVVAMHGVLAGGGSEPHAGPLTVALVAVAAAAMWVRFSRASRASRRGRTALLP